MFGTMKRSAFKAQSAERGGQRAKHPAPSAMLIITALCCTVLISACVKDRSMAIGETAPEISVLDLNDKTVKLSEFRGKVIVLRFWITGCKACVAEMPLIDEISKRYEERGLAVLALNMGDSKERVENFARTLKISYPMLLDPARMAVGKYNVRAAPTTVIIDRRGIVKKRVVGEMTQNQFEMAVVELL